MISNLRFIDRIELASSITHIIGFFLSIAALVLMVVFAVKFGSGTHVVGASIFGSSLILLYAASSLYHFFPKGSFTKAVFRRIDLSMIYVLIAGTYTSICLTIPNRTLGWTLFGLIWGLALVGVIVAATGIKLKEWQSVALYIAAGWIVVLAIVPIISWLGFAGGFWLVLGGVFYTLGCIFYMLDFRMKRYVTFGMHDVFHLFVMAGSFSHFWMVLKHVSFG